MATVGSRFKISGVSGEYQWAGVGPLTFVTAASGVGQDLADAGATLTYVVQGWIDEVGGVFGIDGPLAKAAPEAFADVKPDPTAPKGSEANPLRAHGK